MAQAKKKKKFFEVEIPLIGKETQLQAYELSQLNGRVINYDLTRQLRGKSMLLQLFVSVENNKAVAKPTKAQVLPYFLRRMIRKGTNYVEDSFSSQTTDAQVEIKPFLVTRRKVSRAVRKTLRNKCKEDLINYLKSRTADEVFRDILSNKIQKELSVSLKKIYPLSLCEIRIFRVKLGSQKKEMPLEEVIEEKPKKKAKDKAPKEDSQESE